MVLVKGVFINGGDGKKKGEGDEEEPPVEGNG